MVDLLSNSVNFCTFCAHRNNTQLNWKPYRFYVARKQCKASKKKLLASENRGFSTQLQLIDYTTYICTEKNRTKHKTNEINCKSDSLIIIVELGFLIQALLSNIEM